MKKTLALLPILLLAAGRAGADISEMEHMLNQATFLAQGQSNQTEFVAGIPLLKPDDQRALMARSAALTPPARAIVLYQLAVAGHPEATSDLASLLKQRVLTGKFKMPRQGDNLRMLNMALEGREKGKPVLQELAAGMMLARWDIPEDAGGLSRQVQAFEKVLGGENPQLYPEKLQEAVIGIGCLHLRGVSSAASQQVLEKALRYKENAKTRELSAAFMGALGTPQSVKALLDAMSQEIEMSVQHQIGRTLIAGGRYTDAIRVPLVKDLVRMAQDAALPMRSRQFADLTASQITGQKKTEAQLEWVARKEKDGFAAPAPAAAPPAAPAAPPPPMPATAAPAAPAAPGAAPPATPAVSEAERAKWLLLAKNFANNKNYAKAEEFIQRILAASATGETADEARALKKKIDAEKGS